MKQRGFRSVSPQGKLINTNQRLGNMGIKRQQGTTRIIYDSLPIDGRTEFRFFEGSNNRDFPLTNTGANGNQLGVGETLAIERYYVAGVTTPVITGIPDINPIASGGAFSGITAGELQIEIANQVVMKPIPLNSMLPQFNKNAYHDRYNNFEFDTQLVIPPLLEFIFPIRVPIQAAITDTDLRLVVEGVGAIIAPRQTL